MTKKKKIIFTGGGSGGHVVPAITLIRKLKEHNFEVHYFGSQNGIESKLTKSHVDKYHSISTGKLRRYISVENVIDLFKVALGLLQSIFKIFLIKEKNTVVFSMGGFVSVPVVIAAKVLGVKIFIHEQTTRVGLANKIASKFATKVFVSFEDSLKFFPKGKTFLSGYPVREEFLSQDLEVESFKNLNLKNNPKPIFFITGGGNGSKLLNDKIRENLENLTKDYTVIHQVGSQFIDEFKSLKSDEYLPVPFIGDEMPSLMKASEVILSRSGAGTVAELMALKKKSIFIPLKIAQKNEQFHNAMAAHNAIGSVVVEEDNFKKSSLESLIQKLNTTSASMGHDKSSGREYLVSEILNVY